MRMDYPNLLHSCREVFLELFFDLESRVGRADHFHAQFGRDYPSAVGYQRFDFRPILVGDVNEVGAAIPIVIQPNQGFDVGLSHPSRLRVHIDFRSQPTIDD